jgi:hypothetical protein
MAQVEGSGTGIGLARRNPMVGASVVGKDVVRLEDARLRAAVL